MNQHEKTLMNWVRRQIQEPQRFFKGYELEGSGEMFIGYKVATRFTELCKDYPELIESGSDGRFTIGRIRLENSREFMQKLPKNYAEIMQREMRGKVKCIVTRETPVMDYTTNTVKFIREEVEIN